MRPRRHTAPSLFSSFGGRRLFRQVAIVAAAGLAGYLLTLWLYPTSIFSSGASVPRVLAVGRDEAEQRLGRAGFRVRVVGDEPDPNVPRGSVVWQDPPPGVVAPEGSLVQLTVSSGPPPTLVPDVVGLDERLARELLSAAGLEVGDVDSTTAPAEPGVAVATRPAAGRAVSPGDPVRLVVSSGPPEVEVPQLLGLTLSEARTRLEQAGLAVGTLAQEPAAGAEGVVLDQQPTAGTVHPGGGRVNLVVSRRPGP